MKKKTISISLVVGFISLVVICSSYSKNIMEYSRIFWNYTNCYPHFDSSIINSKRYVFGLDVSKYQGRINWDMVKQSNHPIKYVFIRATMGDDRKDIKYSYNWKEVKRIGLIRGAYHYYDPNENSTLQANNFISTVRLGGGDLPPVLDIEADSKYGQENLIKGLKNWVTIIENHYGVKPIIYSTRGRYISIIKKNFSEYPGWVASYTSKDKINNIEWKFHQFSDNIRVKGIKGGVDGNDFNGNIEELNSILIQ